MINNKPLHYVLLACAVVSVIFTVSIWCMHAVALIYGKWRLYRRKDLSINQAEKSLPGVSILKPLVNANDPNLFQNLETFFTLDYQKYEIIFCIQDEEDERLSMYVTSLREKYPNVDCQIFYGGEEVGVNPKINNMQPGYKAAKYELVLVSDSGIRMREETLSDMVNCMTEKVGLVHQMPFACDRSGIPGTLEKVYFGTSQARVYLVANFLGINCATGMSSLMRKDVLDEAGGLQAFGKYLAEDYFMAKMFLEKGLKLDISSFPALQNPGDTSVSVFQSRLTRWVKLRYAMLPHLMILDPCSECMLLGLLVAWAVFYLFKWDPLSFFLVHLLVWFLMDWALLLVVQNGSLPFNKFEFLVTWLMQEFSAPYLHFNAHWNPVIKWRTKEFKLKWGGLAEQVERKVRL